MRSALRSSRVLLGWLMRFFELLSFCLFISLFVWCARCCLDGVHFPFFLLLCFYPTDEDTAEYIYDNLPAVDVPSSWLTQGRETVVAAIQEELRAWHSTGKTYEERVAATLATLQPPTATFEDNPP